MNISTLKPSQLRKAADLKERIEALQERLNEVLGVSAEAPAGAETEAPAALRTAKRGRRKRRLSAQGIANIRAGVAKRMAKRGARKVAAPGVVIGKPKRKITPAGKRRLSELATARWAARKAAGKRTL